MSVILRGFCPKRSISGKLIEKCIASWGVYAVLFQDSSLQIEGFSLDEQCNVLDGCFGWDTLFIIYHNQSSIYQFPFQSPKHNQSISLPPGPAIQSLSASEVELLVLMKDGNAWSWSLQSDSVDWNCILGPSSSCEDVLGMDLVSQVVCGARHHCALTKSGNVFCWGCNLHSECGHISKEDVISPQLVRAMGGLIIHSISAGLHHTIVSTQSGDVYSWGSNDHGQLGIPESTPYPTLVDDPILENQMITKVRTLECSIVLSG
eukprot:g3958.t1